MNTVGFVGGLRPKCVKLITWSGYEELEDLQEMCSFCLVVNATKGQSLSDINLQI